jgi:hypothetical protein
MMHGNIGLKVLIVLQIGASGDASRKYFFLKNLSGRFSERYSFLQKRLSAEG